MFEAYSRDVRNLESRFWIGFRKTEPTSESQNRMSGFRGILKNWKTEIKQPQFFQGLFSNGVILMIKFYITEYRRLCLLQSMIGDQLALVYSKASNQ